MKLTFFGAAGTVTGSCYLLTANNDKTILVDCGMFQGTEDITKLNAESLGFNPSTLSGVLVTHAHLDHCGRLPLLTKGGFEGKIYMTEPTKMLAEIVMLDSAIIAQENSDHPIYTDIDVQTLLPHIQTINYDLPFSVETFSIVFRNAGHILGSASIEITDTTLGETIVFSGDLGNTPEPLQQPTEQIKKANIVIMESTYGDRVHPEEDIPGTIQQEINMIEKTGGVLLIPAFSIDRTQELLYIIDHLKNENKVNADTPVFLDSPMAIKVTALYETYKNQLSSPVAHQSDDPFSFPGLSMTSDARDSKDIAKIPGSKVIIAGNGMMSGGRIWHHLMHYLPVSTTRLLIVGYQGDETLGKVILEGAKSVQIHGETIPVNATVTDVEGLSAHADQPKLLSWLKNILDVQQVFLTHGENSARKALAEKIITDLHLSPIHLPNRGEELIV